MASDDEFWTFTIHDRVHGLPKLRHHDDSIYPNDLSWYELLEQNVFDQPLRNCICELASTVSTERMILPLLRVKGCRLAGKRLAAMSNYYSGDFRPLSACVPSTLTISKMLQELKQQERPAVLSLGPLDMTATDSQALQQALLETGWALHFSPAFANWTHPVVGDYAAYLGQRPGKVRNTLIRKSRKARSVPNFQIDVHDGRERLSSLLDAYAAVYAKSWKTPESHDRFIPALIRQCAARGELRLGILSIAEQPVAVHFWIVRNGCAYIYKLAHDPEFDKISPGTVLMAEMLKHTIDTDKVEKLDFLTGDDAYKRDWMSVRQVKSEITAYNITSLSGRILYLLERFGRPFVRRIQYFFKITAEPVVDADTDWRIV